MYRDFAEKVGIIKANDEAVDAKEDLLGMSSTTMIPPEITTNRRVTPLLRIDHMVSTACEASSISHRMLCLHDARRHLDHHMMVTKRNAENTPMIKLIEDKLAKAFSETIALDPNNVDK